MVETLNNKPRREERRLNHVLLLPVLLNSPLFLPCFKRRLLRHLVIRILNQWILLKINNLFKVIMNDVILYVIILHRQVYWKKE